MHNVRSGKITTDYLQSCKEWHSDILWCWPYVLWGGSELCWDVANYLLIQKKQKHVKGSNKTHPTIWSLRSWPDRGMASLCIFLEETETYIRGVVSVWVYPRRSNTPILLGRKQNLLFAPFAQSYNVHTSVGHFLWIKTFYL